MYILTNALDAVYDAVYSMWWVILLIVFAPRILRMIVNFIDQVKEEVKKDEIKVDKINAEEEKDKK
jgi:hypothetical protein